MSFLNHIQACNRYRPDQFLPLCRDGARLGWVRRDNAEALRRFPELFAVAGTEVTLRGPAGFDALSRAVHEVVEALAAEGRVETWRDEYFSVAPHWGAPPLFKLDRGAVGFFGTRAYGVHLNGLRREPAGLALWIGRRAADKKVAPGKLDNMVAGGIGHGHGVFETLVKEAAEEAALPPAVAAAARPAGAVSYRMETAGGLREDTLFIYDLDVPADFVPRNTDGEIAEFRLMPAGEALARVRESDDFKFNVNLVLIDFALRHGLIGPEDPDYLDIVGGLHRPPG